ncbi:MAG: DNA repair protein RecN [Bacteroidaceae bacterium]|nr:DNA repair protein RecN [Bacteroidaceae bacterium]
MIKSINIQHYALIDELSIEFHNGFSVITGETGAGKSIILGAIGLLLGQRADSKSIKTGEQRCTIEATFDVTDSDRLSQFFADNDLDTDGHECIIRRELTATGKSRAFINDTPVTLGQLKEIGDQLIDIHSQHQNLLLGHEDFQQGIVDTIAGNTAEREAYRAVYDEYVSISKELKALIDNANQSRDNEDFMRFQLQQLDEANLSAGEQEELEAESEMLTHAEDIKGGLFTAQNCITSDNDIDTLGALKQGINALNSISSVYASAEEIVNRLDSCYIELKDIADELASQADNIEYDPMRLQEVNDRLSLIYSLQQKHHVETIAELIDIQADLTAKLDAIDNYDGRIETLRKEQENIHTKLLAQADILTQTRARSGQDIQAKITETLVGLGMPNVQFEVELTAKATPDADGNDHITFLFSANKNVPVQNLTQIASGGEIARVMLALKALIANAQKLPTIIFDEIDTGVSGNIAEKMAVIMADIACADRQVISITHLPQIAALGKHHYKVYKEDNMFFTTTHIIHLSQQQRVEEIAHMLSGSTLSQAAINNARELLKIDK